MASFVAPAGSPDQAPAQTPDFTQYAYPAPVAAKGQSATLLPEGRWLLVGGEERGIEAALLDMQTGQHDALAASLPSPRAYHTATVLPDGSVLILGGMGQDGAIASSAVLFQPATQTFEILPDTGLIPRARHTATLLTDGRVLIAGGVSDRGMALPEAELWNPRTRTSEPFHASLVAPRFDHNAVLLSSDPVLLWGGSDDVNRAVTGAERYDPQSERFDQLDQADLPATPQPVMPAIAASLPAHEAQDVAIDSLVAVRFSKHLAVTTLSAETVTLLGSSGPVPVKATPAEGGLLLFVTPNAPLQPASQYTLFIAGARDQAGAELPFSAVSFTTAAMASHAALASAASAASVADDGQAWHPGPDALRGDWRAKRPASPQQNLPALQATPGTTALAGQVLFLDGNGAAGVTLAIGNKRAQADASGRFLLTDVPAGRQTLLIDGTSANAPGATYGLFEVRVEIRAGQTNVLPYTSWMPRIDTQHAVFLPSPTTAETVVTSPFIPGLELHIPKDTVIRDRVGRVVTEVSITPIPIDRPPFPLPTREVPVFFTIQPGGAHLQGIDLASAQGARLIYPNYSKEPAGTRIDFWNYDPVDKGWYVYGQGTVSQDGKQVVPDPGVAIYEFTGAMIGNGGNPPAKFPPPGKGNLPATGTPNNGGKPGAGRPPCGGQGGGDCGEPAKGGEPVDLATGLFVTEDTDLYLADTIPLALTRTYRPADTASRTFGIGTTLPYDLQLWSNNNYQEADLILPDGGRIHYVRISSGTGWTDAIYEHTATPSPFYKSRLTWNGHGWDVTLKDGTVYVFPEFAPLSSVRDRYGNSVAITRSGTNITRLTSPNGRTIDFTYDASNRIIQATDNIGRSVGYTYDASGRLWKVTDPGGGVKEYTYDTSHRMLTIKDPRLIVHLTNTYDSTDRVIRQTLVDGSIYAFAYTVDGNGKIVQTDVTDPRGKVRRVTFNAAGYPMSDTWALGQPEQQSWSYQRDSASNLLLSVTDPLNRVTAYSYDAKGNTTTITRLSGTPDAVTTTYTYEPAFNQVASITDPLGHAWSFAYDSRGNLTSASDPLDQQRSFTYNFDGQPATATDPLGHTTQLGYDLGDLVSITDPLGHTATRFLDGAGRVMTVADPLGNLTRYDYDPLDRVTHVTDPLGAITQFAYDPNGNLLTLTDARGSVTAWIYDAKDRVSSRTDPLLKTESYAYDLNDNLTSHTDRKGQVTSYQYDAINRMTFLRDGAGLMVANYQYDSGNRLTFGVDVLSGYWNYSTRVYDDLDRLTSEQSGNGSVAYTYDAAGRRTGMTVAGQPAVTYTYDDANRLTGITQGASSVTIAYDVAGRRTNLTLPNGVTVAYGYDNANRLISLAYYQNGAILLGDLSYTYDATGRRTAMSGSLANANLPQAVQASYDAANRLASWGGTSLTYDANGNLTGDGIQSYTWDLKNRLTAVTSGAASLASFRYDALDRRPVKTISGVTTNVLHDGINPVQELSGGTPTVNLLTGLGVDEIFTRTDAAGSRTFLTDALGSTLALADASGAIQTSYAYEPYGKATQSGQASGNTFQYTGRENDGSGLYYYRARYYSPQYGRFVSEDPIGFGGGINLYSYVGGNPVSRVDPLGLFFQFSISQQSLTWVDPNTGGTSPSTTWPARSGPWGKGPLPEGWYELTPEEKPVKSEKRSMQDTCGNDYKFRLHPQFPTDRDGLLIHPDGGTPGTMGCVGAQGCTSSLRNFINSGIHGGGGLNVKVVP